MIDSDPTGQTSTSNYVHSSEELLDFAFGWANKARKIITGAIRETKEELRFCLDACQHNINDIALEDVPADVSEAIQNSYDNCENALVFHLTDTTTFQLWIKQFS